MKTAFWVILVLVILAAGWWFMGRRGPVLVSTTPTASPVGNTSDASLDADAAALSSQMNSIDSSLSDVQKGLSDSPIPQAQ